ncbi:kelch domain-containing protein 3 [Entomortierella beljakovae]|nr:kelch domain-containing protein 3 [Entomortierella beljakovae]
MALFISVLVILAVANAQPSSIPARSTRAITLVGDTVYLYGGSGSNGSCYSDFYSLNLDPSNGWVAAQAPWNSIQQSNPSELGENSWAIPSTDGSSLLFYGQTLCPSLLDMSNNPASPYVSTSASVDFQYQGTSWTQTGTQVNILKPFIYNPVPVQAIDSQNHISYTFLYDAFNPQLGMELLSLPTGQLSAAALGSAKNTTMVTTQPTPPLPPPSTNGTNTTTPTPPSPTQVVLAPYMDPGSTVYMDGKIIVVAGGRKGGALTGDDVDPSSGLYKTDRCFVYTISTGLWSVQKLTGSYPLSRRGAALLAVGNKIYMHGGNTTETVTTVSYEKDLWILDTQTWEWSSGPSSLNGRAFHTLIHFQDTILSFSGAEFETTKTRAAQNAYIMVYDLKTTTWGVQFGTINESYFSKHGVAIIAGSLAGFVIIVGLAAVAARLFRKYTGRRPIPSSLSRRFTVKPFLATTARKPVGGMSKSTEAANQFPANSRSYSNQNDYMSHIDLSALPRVDDSNAYDHLQSPQQQFNPYASTLTQQRVPLMSDNALENQDHDDLNPYHDNTELEEKDPRPQFVPPLHTDSFINTSPQIESISYTGQTANISGVPVRGEMAVMSMSHDVQDNNLKDGSK